MICGVRAKYIYECEEHIFTGICFGKDIAEISDKVSHYFGEDLVEFTIFLVDDGSGLVEMADIDLCMHMKHNDN